MSVVDVGRHRTHYLEVAAGLLGLAEAGRGSENELEVKLGGSGAKRSRGGVWVVVDVDVMVNNMHGDLGKLGLGSRHGCCRGKRRRGGDVRLRPGLG